jgi:hypothetical protein
MADIRIKDLTTLAPSAVSDDYLAIDGTTNGTRKLSAYSPSFGGNATVGGTLTVSGTGTHSFAGGIASTKSINSPFEGLLLTNLNAGAAAAVYDAKSNGTNLLVSLLTGTGASGAFLGGGPSGVSANIYTTAADIPVVLGTNGAARLWVNATGTTISSTTASTSTSTGALVVGGGVGVAGAAFFGGNATVFGATGITINNVGGAGNDSILTLTQSGVSSAFIKNTATTGDIAIGDGGGTYLRITKGAGVVFVSNTTASNSTSSGALVIGNGTQGGLGVGGNAYIGGDLVVASNNKGIYSQGYVTVKGLQANYLSRGTSGGWTSGVHFYSSNTDVSASIFHNPSTGDLQFYTTASASDYNLTTDRALVINTSKQVQVLASTASTGTSSGALVVSGGVGVAGAIFAGGVLSTVSGAGFNTPDWRFYQSGTSGYIRDLVNGQMALQFISGSASTIQVYATGTQDSTTTTSGALISAGGLGVAGAVNAGTFFGLVDGVTAPSTAGGYARIYVDSADGDLKVKFGDGTVKTIATDS